MYKKDNKKMNFWRKFFYDFLLDTNKMFYVTLVAFIIILVIAFCLFMRIDKELEGEKKCSQNTEKHQSKSGKNQFNKTFNINNSLKPRDVQAIALKR